MAIDPHCTLVGQTRILSPIILAVLISVLSLYNEIVEWQNLEYYFSLSDLPKFDSTRDCTESAHRDRCIVDVDAPQQYEYP